MISTADIMTKRRRLFESLSCKLLNNKHSVINTNVDATAVDYTRVSRDE